MALQQGLVTITGRVGSIPQGHGNNAPPTICTFRLGCTRGYYDVNRQWKSVPTTWITVKTFRALASNVLSSVRIGEPVIVTGVLATEEWETDGGARRSRLVIEASNVGHDLNYGTARLNIDRKETPTSANGSAAPTTASAAVVSGATIHSPGMGASLGANIQGATVTDALAHDPYANAGAQIDTSVRESSSNTNAEPVMQENVTAQETSPPTDNAQPVQSQEHLATDDGVPPPSEPPADDFGGDEVFL